MIKTIKLRNLIKYLVGLITVVFATVYSTRFFSNYNKNTDFSFLNIKFEDIIESVILVANYNISDTKVESEKISSRSGEIRILEMELPKIEEKEVVDEYEKEDLNNSDEEENKSQRQEGQIKESYTNSYGSVKIKNDTDIKLTQSILKPDYSVKNSKDIIIYHTHTCESYTQTKENSYKASGNFRTTNLNYSVARVGRELESSLKKYKFNIVRNETKHDYPAYSGSYNRSLETIQGMLKKNKEAEIVFDIHRDAIGSNSNYAPTVEINGEKVAQLMFVIGTNEGGGKHPNWKNNLKFAIKVQEKANEMYPGLFRNINLRSATFNQKVTNAASIIEVGATGNTLEEACRSMKYLAEILNEVLNN